MIDVAAPHGLTPLPALMPVVLPNGFRVSHMSDLCSNCGNEIEMSKWVGERSSLGPNCVVFKMRAQCPHCTSPESRHVRLRGEGDGCRADFGINEGEWTRNQQVPPEKAEGWKTGWLSSLLGWFTR